MAEGFALTMDDGGLQTLVNAPQEPQPRSTTVNAANPPVVRRPMTADEAAAASGQFPGDAEDAPVNENVPADVDEDDLPF